MARKMSVFERFLQAAERTADITARWYFQKQWMKEDLLSDQQIERIARRAAEMINISADTSEAEKEIERLKKLIEELWEERK